MEVNALNYSNPKEVTIHIFQAAKSEYFCPNTGKAETIILQIIYAHNNRLDLFSPKIEIKKGPYYQSIPLLLLYPLPY